MVFVSILFFEDFANAVLCVLKYLYQEILYTDERTLKKCISLKRFLRIRRIYSKLCSNFR